MIVPKKWKSKLPGHMQLLFEAKPLLRLVGIISATLLLGISFMLVAQGIIFGILRLSPYFWVAYRPIAVLAGIEYHPEQFKPIEIKWFHFLSILFGLIPSLVLIGAGIWTFLNFGVCGQNLICLILT